MLSSRRTFETTHLSSRCLFWCGPNPLRQSLFFGGMLRPRNIGRTRPDLRGLQKQADIARDGCTFLDLSNLEFQGFREIDIREKKKRTTVATSSRSFELRDKLKIGGQHSELWRMEGQESRHKANGDFF
jgi:hypothetical protein